MLTMSTLTISNTRLKMLETYLLHLELDGSLDFIDLGHHGFLVREKTREFTSLVKTRTQETGDLLNQSLRREESIILLG